MRTALVKAIALPALQCRYTEPLGLLVNPRRACAARVTVVGSVCVCVC